MAPIRAELGLIMRLSGPVVLSQLGMMTMGAVETLMVGHVGATELAACALGNVWEWTWLCLGLGLVMGIDPLISQAHGRGDGPGTALALQRGIVIALIASIPICLCLAFTRQGLILLGQEPAVAELAGTYNLYKLPTVPCYLIYAALKQYLQGRALMLPATLVMWAGNVVHAALTWLLVFGAAGLPALGLIGAAVSESVTFFLLVLGLIITIRGLGLHRGAWRSWRRDSFAWYGLAQTTRIGVPIGMQIAFEAWAFSIATFMAGWLGRDALGSHQIVLNLAALAFMVPLGVSQGAATRVGNLVGAGDLGAMQASVIAAILLGALVMVPPALVFTLLRHELPALYSSDPQVVAYAAQILPIAAAFQLCDGAQVVAGGVLRGMGRPDTGAVLSLCGYYVVALPLAYVAGFIWGYGLLGIWCALAVGLTLVAVALVTLMRAASRRSLLALQLDIERRRSTHPPPSRTVGGAKSTWVV
jgi:multidrug resistance protein, MATE family